MLAGLCVASMIPYYRVHMESPYIDVLLPLNDSSFYLFYSPFSINIFIHVVIILVLLTWKLISDVAMHTQGIKKSVLLLLYPNTTPKI